MAIQISYPTATIVTLSDRLFGTQYDPEIGSTITKNFSIGSIINLVPEGATGATGATGAQGSAGATGSQGSQGVPGPIGPAGLNWKGEWVSLYEYVIDDAVGYDGASWFCILATGASATPPSLDPTYWALLASQGATGPQGPIGLTGDPGLPGETGPTGATGPQGSPGTSGGITTLNTLTAGTQTFATTANGLDFTITSTGSVHSFNIPSASIYARGLVNTYPQGFAGIKTFSSKVKVPELALQQGATHIGELGYNTILGDSGGYYYWIGTNSFASAYFSFAAITSQRNFIFPNATGSIVLGTGITNTLTCFTGTNTISSLSTTVYPSLPEISYVKGVTSAIQTQLNAKQNTITLTTTGTSGAATLVGSTLNIPQYSGGSGIAWLESNATDLTVWNNGKGNIITNTSFGESVLMSNITGASNTAIGYEALNFNTTGGGNTAIGTNSLKSNTQGISNTAIGIGSMLDNTLGIENAALGKFSLYNNTAGNYNVSIGALSLLNNTTGTDNVAIGYQSLQNNISGICNTSLGRAAGANAIGASSNNVYIGESSGPASFILEDNKLYIANNIGTPLIGGDFATGVVTINSILALTPVASLPTSPVNGMITVQGTGAAQHIYCYINGAWKQLDN